MPNNPNRNGKVGFRNLTRTMQALVLLPAVLVIWMALLTSAVSEAFGNVDNSIRETVKKFSLDPENNKFSEANFSFGFDIGFGWVGTAIDWVFSPLVGGILLGVLFCLTVMFAPKFIQRLRSSRRRNRRPAPSAPSRP